MKTEINGDFKGYLKRFKLPSKKSFTLPLKSAFIIFCTQLAVVLILSLFKTSFVSLFILFVVSIITLSYYIKILYKDFWNVVLEESKGFFADGIMWCYYILVCGVSFLPTIIFCIINEF